MQKKSLIEKLDISKTIAFHIAGENYTTTHKKCVGAVIMVSGVGMIKLLMFFDNGFIHFIADIVGYAFHGIGLIPFVKEFEK